MFDDLDQLISAPSLLQENGPEAHYSLRLAQGWFYQHVIFRKKITESRTSQPSLLFNAKYKNVSIIRHFPNLLASKKKHSGMHDRLHCPHRFQFTNHICCFFAPVHTMPIEFENGRIFLRLNIHPRPHVNTKTIRKHLHLHEASSSSPTCQTCFVNN